MGGSLLIVVSASFVLGTMSAARFRRPFDRFTVALSLLLASMPVFWFGLVLLFLFSVIWPLFPTAGMYDIRSPGGLLDLLHHLVLPSIATAASGVAIMTRVTRASMIDVLAQPYILAARARGLEARRVTYVHGVRNVMPQFVNMTGLNIGFMFGGAVFSEVIFTWPGIGLQLYDSILQRDASMVQGCVLAIAVVFVVSNMLADFAVYALDPSKK
jgi:peptide/nickel transport system permease protein